MAHHREEMTLRQICLLGQLLGFDKIIALIFESGDVDHRHHILSGARGGVTKAAMEILDPDNISSGVNEAKLHFTLLDRSRVNRIHHFFSDAQIFGVKGLAKDCLIMRIFGGNTRQAGIGWIH